MKAETELVTSKDVFKHFKLKENSVYLIRVKCSSANVEHDSILFTGFENGAYCEIYSNSYDNGIDMMNVYSMKVIKKLATLR